MGSLNTPVGDPVETQERLCEKLHIPSRVNKRRTFLAGGGRGGDFAFMKAFIFEHPFNQLTEKYFEHVKTRLNLVTQVAEAASLSYWSRKSRIVTEAHGKIVSLQCFEEYQSAFK